MTLSDEVSPSRRRRPRTRASIKDVAAHAGVSAQTVSRVATGREPVKAATRDRVLASMAELGYRPNSAARNLKSGKFRSVGFVTFSLDTVGNSRTLGAVAAAADAAGYTTTLLSLEDPTQVGVAGAFGRLEEQAVDGIILVMSAELASIDELTLTSGLPLVIVDSDAALPYSFVDTDQEQGARLATEHLLALGHRRIAHISGPAKSYSARRREETFRETMQAAGHDAPLIEHGDWTSLSGLEAARRLLAEPDLPTAIFAANDQMAHGAYLAVRERGLSIPDDVSVVGFDDVDDAQVMWPPLTTVHQNFDQVGRDATAVLLEMINGAPDARQRVLVPTSLVVRSSAAAPPTT